MTDYQPLGAEFLVNSTTLGDQNSPSITALADGGFVVSWMSMQDSGWGVYAQRYTADGTVAGAEFRVNSTTSDDQFDPSITALADGGFLVSWTSDDQDGNSFGIYAQRYAADGTAAGAEFQVNSTTGGEQYAPSVTALADGGFVVSWMSNGQDGSGFGVYAQRYAADGTAAGAEFQVNSTTANSQEQPSVTALADGGFVVSWMSDGQDGSFMGIYAQRYAADSTAVGAEFQVNSTTAGDQWFPSVTALADGGFVVSWMSNGQDGSGFGVYAQRYAADGTAAGAEFQVNSTTANSQEAPSVTALADGGFVVSWMSYGQDGNSFGIYAQRYAADGTAVGAEFQVNSTTADDQFVPSVTALADGGFVVSWMSNGQDGSGWGIYAQIYGAEESSPPVAQDDSFTTNELTAVAGNLFADNGSGADSDPDGPALAISEVNGSSANVGSQITLASGALLTVNADGTFAYDPNGAFEYTPTVGSGASNTPSTDSFTYVLAGGGTATVTLTITGADNNDYILGTANNDLLTGGPGADTMYGLDGHDLLRGFGGADAIYGGDGDDYISGNNGDDLIDGGAGFDRAGWYQTNAALGGVTVDLNIVGPQNTGSQGWDTLTGIEYLSGTPFADTFIGDANDNILWGSSSLIDGVGPSGANNDTLDGGGGNDLLAVGIGNHSLTGGSGIDTVSFTESFGDDPSVSISLALQGAAQDTGQGLWTLNGIENLSGGDDDDELTGDDNANILAGWTGNDQLVGGSGNDTLYGDGRINSGAFASGPPTLFPDVQAGEVAGDDTLEGGEGDDQIYGGGGVDTASYASASGAVTVGLYNGGFGEAFGAAGYDQLHDIENVTGSAYNDTLTGNALANVLSGGDGDDLLRGFDGNDMLYGGSGNDILKGQIGDDLIDGGAGIDRAGYYQANAALGGVTVSLLLQGTAQYVGSEGWDTLVNIENVFGTPFADTITGDNGNNWLSGSEATIGAIVSPTNNDTIDGQGGNDLLSIGIGNHTLIGGSGIDTVWFTEHGFPETGITVSLALQGSAQATGNGSWNLSGIENLTGGVANDTLTGDGGANVLGGNAGNDTLIGGAGDDVLYGDGAIGVDANGVITTYADVATISVAGIGADVAVMPGVDGNDTLEGGLGNDQLFGGGGNDMLIGGKGDDLIYGGQGNDVVSGGAGVDRFIIEGSSGADRITDFAHVDRIVFDSSSGVTAFGQLVFTAVGKDTKITWGTADSITVEGFKPKDLTSADFSFAPSSAANSISTQAVVNELARAINTSIDLMVTGAVAAAGLIAVQNQGIAFTVPEQGVLDTPGTFQIVGAATGFDSGWTSTSSSLGDGSNVALGGEAHEAASHGLAGPFSDLNGQSSSSLEGVNAVGSQQASGAIIELSYSTFISTVPETAHLPGLATGVAIPSSATLLAMKNGDDARGAIEGAGEPQMTADVWRGISDVLEGGVGNATTIDALFNALPSHGGATAVLAASLPSLDMIPSNWMPAAGTFTMEAMAAHPDAVVVT